MTARRETVENPTGYGEIRLTDHKTIKVRYALVVLQTLALPDDGAKTGEIGGPLESRGAIEVIREHGFVDLTGKTFTLITDDERCLKAWAKSGDPVSGLWEIAGSGPQGLEP